MQCPHCGSRATNSKAAHTCSSVLRSSSFSDAKEGIDEESTSSTSSWSSPPTLVNTPSNKENTSSSSSTSESWSTSMLRFNDVVFGHKSFRPNQLESALAFARGSDVFLNAPVGAGKTAAFVIGSVFRTGITVVLEPNTAVIDEQVNRLMLCGIGSVAIHNSLTKHERQDIICLLHHPQSSSKIKFIYTSPEKLAFDDNFLELLQALNMRQHLAGLVFDEAQTALLPGEEYRKAFDDVHRFRDIFPRLPIFAATATCTSADMMRVQNLLRMSKDTLVFTESMFKPNISLFFSQRKKGFVNQFRATLQRDFGSVHVCGAIFVPQTSLVDGLFESLVDEGFSCARYHGLMSSQDLTASRRRWAEGDCIMVAESGIFGLGIHNPSCQWVCFYSTPLSVTDVFQLGGRCGRNPDTRGIIYVFHTTADITSAYSFIERSAAVKGREGTQQERSRLLSAMVNLCNDPVSCRWQLLLGEFGQTKPKGIGSGDCCDNCKRCPAVELRDVTDVVRNARDFLGTLPTDHKVRRDFLTKVLVGSRTKTTTPFASSPHFASSTQMSTAQVARIINYSIVHRWLLEEVYRLHSNSVSGRATYRLLPGETPPPRIAISMAPDLVRARRGSKRARSIQEQPEPALTGSYAQENVDTLKRRLRARGLSPVGLKPLLVARLTASDTSRSGAVLSVPSSSGSELVSSSSSSVSMSGSSSSALLSLRAQNIGSQERASKRLGLPFWQLSDDKAAFVLTMNRLMKLRGMLGGVEGGLQPACQNSALWYNLRQCSITSTCARHIAPNETDTFSLTSLRQIFLPSPDLSGLPAIQFGIAHEEDAIRFFERTFSTRVSRKQFYRHSSLLYLATSPDGVCDPLHAIVEVKCKYPKNGLFYHFPPDAPPEYYHQCQHHLLVVGAPFEKLYLCIYNGKSADDDTAYRVYTLYKDPAWQAKARRNYESFYEQHLSWWWDCDWACDEARSTVNLCIASE